MGKLPLRTQVPAVSTGSTRTAATTKLRRRRPRPTLRPRDATYSYIAFFATVSGSALTAEAHLAHQEAAREEASPPEFLCPHLSLDACDASSSAIPSTSFSSPTPTTFYVPKLVTQVPRDAVVADKYVSGTDKFWRKTDYWELYGSTMCPTSGCPSTTLMVTTRLATLAAGGSSAGSSIVSILTEVNASPSIYPSGWPAKPRGEEMTTSVIVVLAVLIAVIISGIMIICVWWRHKRMRRANQLAKKVELDLEAGDESDEEEEEEEVRRARWRQRSWAKATARWKANVRLSARKRWKRPLPGYKDAAMRSMSSTHQTSQSSLSLPHRADVPEPTRRAATSSPSPFSEQSHSPETAPFAEPPAYLPSHSRAQGTSEYPGSEDTTSPSLASHHAVTAAHVATDEKATLARMASMASAPPSTASSPPPLPIIYASVPEDSAFEELPPDLQMNDLAAGRPGTSNAISPHLSSLHLPAPTYSRDPSPGPSSLPSPPAKLALAGPEFYEYPPAFEDDVFSAEPGPSPSAPPFEEAALPVPSAPPLDLEDASSSDAIPSAPPFEGEVRGDGGVASPRLAHADPLADSHSASAFPGWEARSSPPQYLP